MKQAILGWSFRQNIFPASLLQKSSNSTHDEAAVPLLLLLSVSVHCVDGIVLAVLQQHRPQYVHHQGPHVIHHPVTCPYLENTADDDIMYKDL